MDINKEKSKLNDQIWTTRVSRVNAEKRLENKEAFIEGINIYYSCFAVVVSLILILTKNDFLDLIVLAMTIVLTISILFFKSLRFSDRAQAYRQNYTDMQKLEFELSHDISAEQLLNIQKDYCDLLQECENHISYDYYKTVLNSSGEYRKEHYSCSIWAKYWWNWLWRFLVKLFCIVLPEILIIVAWWWQSSGHTGI